MKSRKLDDRQAPYHAYSTYIQTTNQESKDPKSIKKAQTNPRYVQKGNMAPPPHHLNFTMFSLGVKEPQTRTKIQKYKIKKHKYTLTNTQIQNTT